MLKILQPLHERLTKISWTWVIIGYVWVVFPVGLYGLSHKIELSLIAFVCTCKLQALTAVNILFVVTDK